MQLAGNISLNAGQRFSLFDYRQECLTALLQPKYRQMILGAGDGHLPRPKDKSSPYTG